MPKAKITPHNVKKFITGWVRWFAYEITRSKYFKNFTDAQLLPNHLQEQFKYRLQVMDKECLANGHCKACGCKTPQLQLADESCDGNCYPPFMEKEEWEKYKKENHVIL